MTISGSLFGIFQGDSCVRARKAESALLLVVVIVIAANCGLIIMYSLLPFIDHS